MKQNTYEGFVCFISFFLQLRNCNPKPSDPIQFIRDHLIVEAGAVTTNADEMNTMKQNLVKLNDDICQMKDNLSKIARIVARLLPELPSNNEAQIDDSLLSMENNVGDASHITMLDSSEDFDITTVNNSMDSDISKLMASDQSSSDVLITSKIDINEPLQDFTEEMIEVDVFQQSQSSHGSLLSSEMPINTPNTTLTGTTDEFDQKDPSIGESEEITKNVSTRESENTDQNDSQLTLMKHDNADEPYV